MKDEKDINSKRTYWESFYFSLDPLKKSATVKSEEEWITAFTWLKVLDWVLGKEKDSQTVLRPIDDTNEWN